MDMQTIREIQGYAAFLLLSICAFALYGYYYHLYKSEKTGRRNYENYSNLALKDDLNAEILESVSIDENAKKEK
ncbi:MAG: cytochrome c oxidase, cbb3-type, CcoQ subunit [Campylobacter sp.]